MHCVHVKEVAYDSSKRFSRGRHFYKRLLLAGIGGRSKARLGGSGGRSKARRDGRVKQSADAKLMTIQQMATLLRRFILAGGSGKY